MLFEVVAAGLGRFEGRASLKTWVLRIVAYRARTRAERDRRSVPLSALLAGAAVDRGTDEPAVEPEQFHDAGHLRGHWISVPHPRRVDNLVKDWTKPGEGGILLGSEAQ